MQTELKMVIVDEVSFDKVLRTEFTLGCYNMQDSTVLEFNFFCRWLVLATWYKKVVAKLTVAVANIGGHVIAHIAILCQIDDKTQFHMVKGIDNAFDHVELCFVLSAEE